MRNFPKTHDEVWACIDALAANPVPMNPHWIECHVNTAYQLKVTLAYLFGENYNRAFHLLERDTRKFAVATPKLYTIESGLFLDACRNELIELLDYSPYDGLYVTLSAAFELTLYDAARELADIATVQAGLRTLWHKDTVAPAIQFMLDKYNAERFKQQAAKGGSLDAERFAIIKEWLIEGKRL